MAQLVEALRYKPEGRGFDSRWCHRNFSLTLSFRPNCGPGVNSASNTNVYQKFNVQFEGTAIPLQAWTDPEGSRSLRFPDFKSRHMKLIRLSAQSWQPYHLTILEYYQEYFLCVKADGTLGWQPYHLHVPTLEIWKPQPPGTLRVFLGL